LTAASAETDNREGNGPTAGRSHAAENQGLTLGVGSVTS
jgi:hypothetical protein